MRFPFPSSFSSSASPSSSADPGKQLVDSILSSLLLRRCDNCADLGGRNNSSSSGDPSSSSSSSVPELPAVGDPISRAVGRGAGDPRACRCVGSLRSHASAALCNLLLDFSPLKAEAVERGALELCAALAADGAFAWLGADPTTATATATAAAAAAEEKKKEEEEEEEKRCEATVAGVPSSAAAAEARAAARAAAKG